MSEDDLKDALRAAFILKLKQGRFSERDFEEYYPHHDAMKALKQLLDSGYLIEGGGGDRKMYVLSEKGRAQLKVVLCGGVYDVMHLGHLAALREAKSLGDVLVVVVATDVTVESFKGRKPLFPEEDRRAMVEALKPVDVAILGYEDVGLGYEQILLDVMPDVVALGYDQNGLERSITGIITRRGLKVTTVKLSKFTDERYTSSTAIKERLNRSGK